MTELVLLSNIVKVVVYGSKNTPLPVSEHLSPIKSKPQLQVSLATQAPFSHGGSHTTGKVSMHNCITQELESYQCLPTALIATKAGIIARLEL